jgi:hypothetical protein
LNAIWKYPALSLIALAAGMAPHANAQTVLTVGQSVPFATGAEFIFNGLVYDLAACSGGVCGAAGAVIEAVNISNVLQIEIIDPGTPLLSVTVPATQPPFANADMTYSFNIWAVSPKTTINSVTNIVGGSASVTADQANIKSVATINPGNGTTPPPLTSTVAVTAAPLTFSAVKPTSTSPLSISYDVSTHSFGATAGDVLKLSNVNLILSPAPEPATIALVATGLIGLGAARRRSRRRD